MKYLILSIFLITGCQPVPIMSKWPEVPAALGGNCPDLGEVDTHTTKLSDVFTVVTENYSKYHECQVKVDAWLEWYHTQQTIYTSIK
jgi:hypothetical protein